MNEKVIRMDDNTWRIEECVGGVGVYMYLLEGSESAVLIDTGYGTIDLPAITGSLTKKPVRVLNTHFHGDHVGGNKYYDYVYMHEDDAQMYLSEAGDNEDRGRTLHTVRDGDVIDIGGVRLEVIHTPGHSRGCICLLEEAKRRLFTGDSCCKADVLLFPKGGGTDVAVYLKAMERLKTFGDRFDVTWPAHHSIPVEPEIIDQFIEACKGIVDGTLTGVPAKTPFGPGLRLNYRDIGVLY